MSRAVATVESLGYVVRQPDPADARASLLSLTPGGVQFLAEQHREHARRVAAVLDGWDDAKAREVLQGLTELDTALSRTVADMRTGGIPALSLTLEPPDHRVRRQRRRRHHHEPEPEGVRMTVTTERPTDSALEEPSSRTALRKRPEGRHRATAVVRADSIPGEMTHRQILESMTGLLAALFTAMLSSTIVSVALPTIIGDLHGTQRQYTWVITAALLATTVTTPIWGKLADLFNKKLLVQSRS